MLTCELATFQPATPPLAVPFRVERIEGKSNAICLRLSAGRSLTAPNGSPKCPCTGVIEGTELESCETELEGSKVVNFPTFQLSNFPTSPTPSHAPASTSDVISDTLISTRDIRSSSERKG